MSRPPQPRFTGFVRTRCDGNTTSFFLKHLLRAYQISDAKNWRWSGSLSYSPWALFFLIPPKPASFYHLMEAEKFNVSLSRKKWKRISNQEGWESEWVWGLCNNTCLQVGQRNLPKVGKTSRLIRVLECWACEWGGEKKEIKDEKREIEKVTCPGYPMFEARWKTETTNTCFFCFVQMLTADLRTSVHNSFRMLCKEALFGLTLSMDGVIDGDYVI